MTFALISEEIQQAQALLQRVEEASASVGLAMNDKKTKILAFNQKKQVEITAIDGLQLEVLQDFKYLGSMMSSTEANIKARKGMAWTACNKMDQIWKSNLNKTLKIRLLPSTVEAVLLYGCETWSLSKKQEQELDGCDTKMLRKALNISWREHVTNELLYEDLPKILTKIRTRRLKLAGHCARHPEEADSNLVLWVPDRGSGGRVRPTSTFIHTLTRDTGLQLEETHACMQNKGQCGGPL